MPEKTYEEKELEILLLNAINECLEAHDAVWELQKGLDAMKYGDVIVELVLSLACLRNAKDYLEASRDES